MAPVPFPDALHAPASWVTDSGRSVSPVAVFAAYSVSVHVDSDGTDRSGWSESETCSPMLF
jgi:hypothetical protein